ncbi:MAG: hypothetical protein J6L60_07830 [Bacteroidaceae bacterium]|nr:hypothetical protein [Bacteroidaceae bacterium]
MGQNKYLKIFSVCGFIAFAAVSCWATAESLHLLLPALPLVLAWIITIGFFVIASIGSKLIVDSLNQNIYMEKRGLNLVGGLILLLVFWLICSMPTNTHTFFYRNCITDVTLDDLKNTESYLNDIRDNTFAEEKIRLQCADLENKVHAKLEDLRLEIEGPDHGDGPKAQAILVEISELLKCAPITKIDGPTATKQQRTNLVNAYRDKIDAQLQKRKAAIYLQNVDEKKIAQAKKDASEDIKKVQNAIIGLNEMRNSGVQDDATINTANGILKGAYSTVKNYSDMVMFKSDTDKEAYTADNQVTKTTRLLSVIDTWMDFIKGEYAGRGFIFWIIISILVDVAAFVFFDIAFKKSEY